MSMNNLSNLFNARKKMDLYNDKNAADRTAADVNGDGRIDKNDKASIQKDLDAQKSELFYDVNGDGKVDFNDLVVISGAKKDIDGDGKVDEDETKFMQEQQKALQTKLVNELKSNKNLGISALSSFYATVSAANLSDDDKKNLDGFLKEYETTLLSKLTKKSADSLLDVNGDGKVTYDDYQAYKEIKQQYGNGYDEKATAKYFKTLDSKMKQVFDVNYGQNNNVNQNDLAKMVFLQNQATSYLNGQTGSFGKLTKEEMTQKFDFNGDGVFDEKDIESSKQGVSNLMEVLGIEDANGDGILDENDIKVVEAKVGENKETVKTKTTEKNNAKTAQDNAKAAQDKAKSDYNAAIKAKDTAQKELDAANNKVKTLNSDIEKLNGQLTAKLAQLAKKPTNKKLNEPTHVTAANAFWPT